MLNATLPGPVPGLTSSVICISHAHADLTALFGMHAMRALLRDRCKAAVATLGASRFQFWFSLSSIVVYKRANCK